MIKTATKKAKIDLLTLRSLREHWEMLAHNERIEEINRQFDEDDCDLLDLRRRLEDLETEAARSYVPGERIPPALEDEMDEIRVQMDGLHQQLRVLDAAREKALEDRAALIEDLREEIAGDLRQRHADAVRRLHAALCEAATVNEEVKQLEEAAARLCGRTYGAGTENTAGIGTGGGSMLIATSPLPDLSWRELSIRTTPYQSSTRLLHWTEFANDVLGLDLEKPEIE